VILTESGGWFYHEVPDKIAETMMGGRYRGNRQKWFAMRFTGTDNDVDLVTEGPEFDAWKWVSAEQLPELVVAFLRRLYHDVLAEFRPLCTPTCWYLGAPKIRAGFVRVAG
jgi:putative (di)nucleoside polyphosphate hydrolase